MGKVWTYRGFFFFFFMSGDVTRVRVVKGFKLKGRKQIQKKWKSVCPTTLRWNGLREDKRNSEQAIDLSTKLVILRVESYGGK